MWKFALGVLLAPVMVTASPFTVVAYNVENLHDADGVAVYDDFQPSIYTHLHALTKVKNIATVLAKFGGGQGPEIVLFDEVEIDQTPGKSPPDYAAILKRYADTTIDRMLGPDFNPEIADLPAEALLLKACADRGLGAYTVVTGGDSPGKYADGHGHAIKTVIFTRFPVKAVHTYPMLNARNLLEVQLDVDGHPLYVFNNHWKSGAGDPKTEVSRIEDARVLRRQVDALLKTDPEADIIIGGDLNSQYNQKKRYPAMKVTGINDILDSQGDELAVRTPAHALYNLWYELPPDKRGSDTFHGEWGTLMNLIISRGLYDERGVQYVDNSFGVAKFPGLNADASGLPNRWSSDGPAGSGFSDHFPVYARFTTVQDNRPDRFMTLSGPAGHEDAGAVSVNAINYGQLDLKDVLTPASLPPGANLRDGTYSGRIFHIVSKADVDERGHVKVTINDLDYDVFSHDKGIRDSMRAEARAGKTLHFYGQLGTFKGDWQFVLEDKAWLQ